MISAKKMIKEFSKSGANAVKLQTINIDESYQKMLFLIKSLKVKIFHHLN